MKRVFKYGHFVGTDPVRKTRVAHYPEHLQVQIMQLHLMKQGGR